MIKTMKKCYRNKILMTIFLVFVLSVSSFAQRNADVMGRVTDSITKSGIPYAAVRLFDSIGNLQNGCITDTFGYFNMKKFHKAFTLLMSHVSAIAHIIKLLM